MRRKFTTHYAIVNNSKLDISTAELTTAVENSEQGTKFGGKENLDEGCKGSHLTKAIAWILFN